MERHLEVEKYQMRVHEQGYTQSDTEEFDRKAHAKLIYVPSSDIWAYYRDQHNVVQHHQGGGSDTIKTKEHLNTNKLHCGTEKA